jgi:hypothetical protein
MLNLLKRQPCQRNRMAICIILTLLIFSCNSNQEVRILLIGDSTMADKPNPEENPERGWGQMLPDFFDKNLW